MTELDIKWCLEGLIYYIEKWTKDDWKNPDRDKVLQKVKEFLKTVKEGE